MTVKEFYERMRKSVDIEGSRILFGGGEQIYGWECTFDFGKYKGSKVHDVLTKDPQYIEWNLINNEKFLCSQKVLDELYKLIPHAKTSIPERKTTNNP